MSLEESVDLLTKQYRLGTNIHFYRTYFLISVTLNLLAVRAVSQQAAEHGLPLSKGRGSDPLQVIPKGIAGQIEARVKQELHVASKFSMVLEYRSVFVSAQVLRMKSRRGVIGFKVGNRIARVSTMVNSVFPCSAPQSCVQRPHTSHGARCNVTKIGVLLSVKQFLFRLFT